MSRKLREYFDHRSARRAGKRDGKKGIPLPGEEKALPFSLLAIKERGDQALWGVAEQWAMEDDALKGTFMASKERLEHAVALLEGARDEAARAQMERAQDGAADKAELEKLERMWRSTQTPSEEAKSRSRTRSDDDTMATADELTTATAPSDTTPTKPGERTEEVPDAQTEANSTLQRGHTNSTQTVKHRMGIGPFPYWAIITLVVIGEVPLNAFAFKLFKEADALSYLMTLSVALILIACAHGLGIFLTRAGHSQVERVMTFVLVAVPVLAILVIAMVRNQYLAETPGEASLSPIQGTLAFALINVLIYAGAVMLSYLKHDPQSEHNVKTAARKQEREEQRLRRASWKQQDRAERRRKALEKDRRKEQEQQRQAEEKQRVRQVKEEEERIARLAQRRREEKEEYSRGEYERRRQIEEPLRRREERRFRHFREEQTRLESLSSSVAQVKETLETSRARRQKRWEALRAVAMSKKNYFEHLMLLYCSANIRAREDHRTPQVLLALPSIETPSIFLDGLDCEDPVRAVSSDAGSFT
ncbi:MAG: hypothetical protein ABR529_12560 [Actinomycetota bacterium]